MTGLRVMIAFAAYKNNIYLYATDAVKTYAICGPFAYATYLVVDEAVHEWDYEQYKILLRQPSLVEFSSSSQGHPDTWVDWQEKANTELEGLRLKMTVHEPYLYQRDMGDIPDQLMCRQVDDMLLGLKTKEELDTQRDTKHDEKMGAQRAPSFAPSTKYPTPFSGIVFKIDMTDNQAETSVVKAYTPVCFEEEVALPAPTRMYG